jgi:hypothetical protein
VTEQRSDRFEAHPSVDRLGGKGVAELVGVDVSDAGVDADASHDAVHGPPVDRDVAVGEESALGADVVGVGGGPVGEEGDEVGVQGDEPVVAELADRHAEPVGVPIWVTASAASSQSSVARRPVRASISARPAGSAGDGALGWRP